MIAGQRLGAAWRHVLARRAAYVVLAVNVLATAAVYAYVRAAVTAQQASRFEERTADAYASLRDRMDAYVAALRGARGLFAGGRDPGLEGFRDYVASLELRRTAPGIQGLGFARSVGGHADAFERAERSRGAAGFRVWPKGEREPESAIVYLEPLDWRNERAVGFDMTSEARRRGAMERARDTGEPACSARVELVQEYGGDRQPGVLVYLAVYEGAPRTEAERRERLRGWVYAPFRASDLVAAALAGAPLEDVALDVVDGDADDVRELLYRSGAPPGGAAPFTRVARLEVASRPWSMRFAATPAFVAPWEVWLPRGTLLLGALVSLALFGVALREARSREAAELSARRASFLAEAGEVLASSLDYRATTREVARIAARTEADYCVILLLEPDGPLRVVGHRDEEEARRAGALLAGIALDPEGRLGAAGALASGAPFVAHDVDPGALARLARTPEQAEAAVRVRISSLLTVPMRARGERVGAITFAAAGGRRFGTAELALAEDLARLVVAAVDNARLYARAQEAVRLRDEFLSIASHELKTPLTSLGLQADSLDMSAARAKPDVVARKAAVIRRNVDRLTRLVATLLDISRLGESELALELEEVDLGELVREVAARFEDEAAHAGCELRVDAPAVRGRWDRFRLDQVVTNLFSNAVKYGTGRPVTVVLRGGDGTARLDVTDEGIGIPPEAQERIFGRFERAVSDRNYGGFGLGLWIARRVVDALGGEVTVASAPGRGSTFTVLLPVDPAAATPGRRADGAPRERRDEAGRG